VKAMFGLLLLLPLALLAQERSELVGQLGGRTALLVLHGAQRLDGGWQVTGEYLLFPTLARRFLEGERSPELGVTTLKEGTTPILFGRDPTGELRGTWLGGAFKGMRYDPGGQERERFEFSEEFPPMDRYSATVQCQAGKGSSREVGDEVKVDAEQCARQCAASPQPLLVDRRGSCRVLRPEAR
jgi:hypothetical protein